MSQENYDNNVDGSQDDSTLETLDALNSSSEMSFVAEEQKKPMNKTSLVLFLVVALGGGGLWLMHAKLGPKSAAASNEAVKAGKTIDQFLNGGTQNIKSMENMLRNTEKIVQQFNNDQSSKQVPLGSLQTNPFRVSTGEGEEDPTAKRKLAEQRQAVLKDFQSLQLQSIMHGKVSTCMINNTLYKEGQQVNGFTIDKIDKDVVSVRQGAWKFDLKMQK
jgi:hypothetical protein